MNNAIEIQEFCKSYKDFSLNSIILEVIEGISLLILNKRLLGEKL